MTGQTPASTSDARKRQAETISVKVSVDTDELREWAGKHADAGQAGVAHVLYATARELETGSVPAFLDGGGNETPPPAEPAPWSVLSTDREKPTLAKVTWSAPIEYVVTGELFVKAGYVWLVIDSTDPRNSKKIGDVETIESVEEIHTLDPSTHVPVERALIDEWLRDEPMIVDGIRRDMQVTPGGRGGELRHTPATPGRGAGGCPADALVSWADRLAALADGNQS